MHQNAAKNSTTAQQPAEETTNEAREAAPTSLPSAVEEINFIVRTLLDPDEGPRRREELALRLHRLGDALSSGLGPAPDPVPEASRRAYASLSPREQEIFAALAEGLTVNEIAARLNRSPKTVNNHRTHLMRKLGLKNTSQLTRLAIRLGLASI